MSLNPPRLKPLRERWSLEVGETVHTFCTRARRLLAPSEESRGARIAWRRPLQAAVETQGVQPCQSLRLVGAGDLCRLAATSLRHRVAVPRGAGRHRAHLSTGPPSNPSSSRGESGPMCGRGARAEPNPLRVRTARRLPPSLRCEGATFWTGLCSRSASARLNQTTPYEGGRVEHGC